MAQKIGLRSRVAYATITWRWFHLSVYLGCRTCGLTAARNHPRGCGYGLVGPYLASPSSRLWQSVRQTGLRQAVRSQSRCERTHAFSWWVTFSPSDAFLVKFSATAKMNRILSWKSEDVWSVEKR